MAVLKISIDQTKNEIQKHGLGRDRKIKSHKTAKTKKDYYNGELDRK